MSTRFVSEKVAVPPTTAEQRAGKYLTFQLGTGEFAFRVTKVREIIGVLDITCVPQTPAAMKGVINLRGKVVPVVDLRIRFGLQDTPYTERTCIIVVQVQQHSRSLHIGVIVDSVSEVLNLAAGDVEDTPDFGHDLATSYLIGMAKIKGKVKILLDIDQVLTGQELLNLGNLAD